MSEKNCMAYVRLVVVTKMMCPACQRWKAAMEDAWGENWVSELRNRVYDLEMYEIDTMGIHEAEDFEKNYRDEYLKTVPHLRLVSLDHREEDEEVFTVLEATPEARSPEALDFLFRKLAQCDPRK